MIKYNKPKHKRNKCELKPQKYYIHYPVNSSSNLNKTLSSYETLNNADHLAEDINAQNSSLVESTVMLKAYRLPKTHASMI